MNEQINDINVKAVAIGFLADIGSTFAFGFAFGLLATLLLMSSGEDLQQIPEFAKTTVFRTVMPIAGLLFTALGGYVTARMAKVSELKNSLFMGLASALFGIASEFITSAPSQPWMTGASVVLTIFSALAGGYVYVRTRASEQQNRP